MVTIELMPSLEIIFIAFLAALAWFWLNTLQVREVAIRAARSACDSEGLLLLDDTVAIVGMKLSRDEDGRITLQRAYEFEYSDTGNNRRKGSVVLLGRKVVLLNIGLRDAYPSDSQY